MDMERHEPADTRNMGIVHSALRRDLERTRWYWCPNHHPTSDADESSPTTSCG